MKTLKTVEITVKYLVPMYCKSEKDFREIFEKNRKEIMDGYEENYRFEETSGYEWNEDAQVFKKEGTWLDVEGALLLMRFEENNGYAVANLL